MKLFFFFPKRTGTLGKIREYWGLQSSSGFHWVEIIGGKMGKNSSCPLQAGQEIGDRCWQWKTTAETLIIETSGPAPACWQGEGKQTSLPIRERPAGTFSDDHFFITNPLQPLVPVKNSCIVSLHASKFFLTHF